MSRCWTSQSGTLAQWCLHRAGLSCFLLGGVDDSQDLEGPGCRCGPASFLPLPRSASALKGVIGQNGVLLGGSGLQPLLRGPCPGTSGARGTPSRGLPLGTSGDGVSVLGAAVISLMVMMCHLSCRPALTACTAHLCQLCLVAVWDTHMKGNRENGNYL